MRKIKMRTIATIIGTLFLPLCALADTHYVSPSGSDTYPYTTWETAADSIMKAMNVADPGDTLMVGAGDYYPDTTIVMKDSISFIGAGMDSCRIHGDPGSFSRLIYLGHGCLVEGFHILESNIGIRGEILLESIEVVRNNKITNCETGLLLGYVSIIIDNNIISDNNYGISLGWGDYYSITHNTFRHNDGKDIDAFVGDMVIIATNNVMERSENVSRSVFFFVIDDSIYFANNIIYDNHYDALYLSSNHAAVFENNAIIRCGQTAIFGGIGGDHKSVFVNNILAENKVGLDIGGDPENAHLDLLYNDFWGNTEADTLIDSYLIRDSTIGNISADPMFADSFDLHLQKYSPCIDAGDPNIKDLDSSRSDIGAYGGPLGQTYAYLDLPPKAPDSLSAISESTVILISWRPNTEFDLSHYLVYKDTIAFFDPDSSKIAAEIDKDSSTFRDLDFILGNTYYYKISAWDLTGHESPYSEELEVLATSVPWEDEIQVMTRTYQLYQNYPNPFNPQTTIRYYLPNIGYQPAEVELKIYNILGELVRVLVSERQYPGEHRVMWDGKNDRGEDLASGVYFYRLKVSGIEFVKGKKMVLVR
jgi:parallel beta-helix repeat protein